MQAYTYYTVYHYIFSKTWQHCTFTIEYINCEERLTLRNVLAYTWLCADPYAEPTPSFADRCLPVVAVYRRWCHKQPVCGLFLLVQLLVFQPALEIYKIQRAEVKLSLKYNEKDGLWPLLCSSCWVFVFVFNIMSVMYFFKLPTLQPIHFPTMHSIIHNELHAVHLSRLSRLNVHSADTHTK